MPTLEDEVQLTSEEKYGIIKSHLKNIEMQKFTTELSIAQETALGHDETVAELNDQMADLLTRQTVILSEAAKYSA